MPLRGPGATAGGYRPPTVTSAAPLQFLILLVASWIGRRQGEAIEYLRAENRVLRARLGPKRLRFADAERRLLAQKGKPLGRKLLAEMASLGFFSVEVLTRGGFVRHLVLFVIDLKTRRVHVAGVTSQADGAWMAQVARNLTDAAAGPLTGFGHMIVDRDPLYTAHFRALLQAAGVQLLRLPRIVNARIGMVNARIGIVNTAVGADAREVAGMRNSYASLGGRRLPRCGGLGRFPSEAARVSERASRKTRGTWWRP